MKIIDAWNLRAELEEVAVPNTMADIRAADGNRVSLMDYERRGTEWYGNNAPQKPELLSGRSIS